jgi:uncharacterized cupredoxin-like copper-binding protein
MTAKASVGTGFRAVSLLIVKRAAASLSLAAVGVAGLVLGHAAASNSSAADRQAVTRVAVVASEWKFSLSKRTVPAGTVVFTVKNKGKIAHDFKIAGKKTKLIAPGKSASVRVVFKKGGRFAYICTVPGHAKLGMKGVLSVGASPGATTSTATTTTATQTTTVSGPTSTVSVDLYEYRFEFSSPGVPSGTVTFVITNKGKEPHNFDVAGVKAGAILGPGQTERWTVGLPPKTYIVVCDVPFHIDRGMIDQFVVT